MLVQMDANVCNSTFFFDLAVNFSTWKFNDVIEAAASARWIIINFIIKYFQHEAFSITTNHDEWSSIGNLQPLKKASMERDPC